MDTVFLKLLNMGICAGWLILAVIALRLLFRRAPKWTRCVLWAFVALRLICPFSLQSIFSLIPSAQTVRPFDVQYAKSPEIQSGIPAIDNTLNPVIRESFAPTPGASVNPLQIWAMIAGILWLIGLLALLGYALFNYISLRRKVAESVELRPGIHVCDHVPSPFILGFIRPAVYLPTGLSGEVTQYILAHEQAHLARRDHWWKALGFFLLSIYWFHPLVWAAYLLFCRDIELACDEKAVKNWDLKNKKAYSHALVSCSMQKRTVLSCPLAFGEVHVKERVKAVLHYKKPTMAAVAVSIVLCALVAVCFLTNPVGEAKERAQQDGDAKEPAPQDGDAENLNPQDDANARQEPNSRTENDPATPAIPGNPTGAQTVNTGYPLYDSLIASAARVLEHPQAEEYEYEHTLFTSAYFYSDMTWQTPGYLLMDLDGNGVDELLFGENHDDDWNGIIFNIYTISDGKLLHIADGWERNRYYLCENGCIANEGSGGASQSVYSYYTYGETALSLVESVVYDAASDPDHPWFYTTEDPDAQTDSLTPVSEEEARRIMDKYVYVLPQFTPFL